MEVLAPHQFATLLPLVPPPERAGHLAMVHAVIEHAMPGQVLVDDPARPRSCIVLNDAGFHAALGVPPCEPIRPLIARVAATLVSAEPGLLIDVTGQWTSPLRGVLPGVYRRNEYRAPATMPQAPRLPPGFALVPITASIARQFDGAVDPWVVRIWGGPEALVEKSFGSAVLGSNGVLASFCTSLAIGGGEAEIEIGTNEAFRRQGLALVAGCAFIAASSARGLVPTWTCRSDNVASHRLAVALGYEHVRSVECFPLDRTVEH